MTPYLRMARLERGEREVIAGAGRFYLFVRLRPVGVFVGWAGVAHFSFGSGWCE